MFRPLITAVTGLPARFYWALFAVEGIRCFSSGSSPVMAGSMLVHTV
ncbi:hypothetical protein CVCC1112_1689 [Paenarthrobacter nicotinovorans]|nr:hypothetical protein ANMWB30_26230 [Arthrobacter sp. MWB30]GAT87030.1 hypothetical protein CVCC1112_1689 [Paenarthrobacter nicotinovorans]